MNTQFLNIVFKLTILILLFISDTVFSQNKTQLKKIIETQVPENTCISIKNISDSLSSFTFSLNNNFFASTTEIINEIRRHSKGNKDSLFYFAWKYCCDNSYSSSSLTQDKWVTSPLIHFNSTGFGLCGNQAIVLSRLWRLLGYRTQIWDIGGHIVPEVFYRNSWHMLDPAYRVFYTNKNNEIASVQELEKKSSLITKPFIVMKNDTYYKLRYSKQFAKLYKTKANNKLIYTDDFPVNKVTDFNISLPPNAIFEFPGYFYKNLKGPNASVIPNYATCRIKIPPKWYGTIQIPLVLVSISGNGNIEIQDSVYSITDTILINKINKHDEYIPEIKICESSDTIYLIYLMNPAFTKLNKENLLVINGSNIEQLIIQPFYLNNEFVLSEQLKKQYFFYENSRIEFMNNSTNQNILPKKEIKNTKSLLKALENYYHSKANLKEEDIKKQIDKIHRVFININATFGLKRVFHLLNLLPFNYVFDDLYAIPEERLYKTLIYIAE